LELQPDYFWAQYFLALCYLRQQRPTEAKVGLTACLRQRGDFVWIYLMRGYAHGQLDEFAQAEEDFRRALDCKDLDDEARYVLFANRGVLRMRQADTLKPAARLRPAVALLPKPAAIYASLAYAYRDQTLRTAMQDFQSALKLKDRSYEVYLSLALAHQEAYQCRDALVHLDRAIDLPSKQPALFRTRARIHSDLGAYDKALDDFGQAIKLSTDDARAAARDHVERGRILQRLQQHREAVAEYDAALLLQPALAGPYLAKAEALLKLQSYEQAVTALNRYLEVGGKPTAEIFRARARAREELLKYAEALQDYDELIALNAKDPKPHLSRARIYLACKAYQLAMSDFAEALRLGAETWEAYSGRGYARAKLGQHSKALDDADRAVHMEADSADCLYNAARIYSLAAGAIDADQAQRNRTGRDAASVYRGRGLELLHRAMRSIPARQHRQFWIETVQKDVDLLALRGSPRFGALADQYQANGERGTR
jgi:tetratricopeptide (TPR) repeat protein